MAAWSGESSSARGSVAAATATAAPKNREPRRGQALPELGSWFWGGDVESPNRTAKCVQSGGAGRQGAAFVVTEDRIPLEEDGRAPLPVPVVTPPPRPTHRYASPPNCPEREFARRFSYKN